MARGPKTALSISLAPADREILEAWQRSTTIRAGLAKRARIVLCMADGFSVAAVARTVGIARRLVYKWIGRFHAEGAEGLRDKPRPGRKPFFPSARGRASGQDRLRAA